jgi:hypothetical protein
MLPILIKVVKSPKIFSICSHSQNHCSSFYKIFNHSNFEQQFGNMRKNIISSEIKPTLTTTIVKRRHK